MKKLILSFLLFLIPNIGLSEALSTTSLGIGLRSISYTEAKIANQIDEDNFDQGAKVEELNDPIICQRISTPSSLGLELGAGGCVHGGGFWTFAHSISAHIQLIYYPLASRTSIDNDLGIRMKREFFGDLYLIGQGGFSKITHSQAQNTPVTLSMDVLEFGGGVGWTYRITQGMAIGFEGTYLVGSILSSSASGSTTMLNLSGSLTIFL